MIVQKGFPSINRTPNNGPVEWYMLTVHSPSAPLALPREAVSPKQSPLGILGPLELDAWGPKITHIHLLYEGANQFSFLGLSFLVCSSKAIQKPHVRS